MIRFLNKHPWIYVVAAFLLLIGAWTTMTVLAVKHRPKAIENEPFRFEQSKKPLPWSKKN